MEYYGLDWEFGNWGYRQAAEGVCPVRKGEESEMRCWNVDRQTGGGKQFLNGKWLHINDTVDKKNNYLYQEYIYRWKIRIFIQNQMQMGKAGGTNCKV